ncbi:MAG: ABC transporter ATP-binding protein [Sandaracinaceae bacterium]
MAERGDVALHARGLTVRRAGRTVLASVDVEVRYGELVVVLGPNGAGKSTLLRALAGLWASQGEVLLDGVALGRLGPRARAARLTFVPQRSGLAARLRVDAVVAQGRFAHAGYLGSLSGSQRAAVHEAMARVDVLHLAERFYTELSEGEARRVVLARALATGARVLLLDEPTAALDIRHALTLRRSLRGLADAGFALVVVLHDLDDASTLADRAILLRDGRIVRSGPPADVIAPDPIREVYGVELVPAGGLGFRLAGRGDAEGRA